MFLHMRHQTPDAPVGRSASAFGTTEDAAKRGLHRVLHVIPGPDMAFEEKHPPELDAFCDHDAGIVSGAFLVVEDDLTFETALGTLQIGDRAVQTPGALSFHHRFLLVPDLEPPCPLAEACVLVGLGWKKILYI